METHLAGYLEHTEVPVLWRLSTITGVASLVCAGLFLMSGGTSLVAKRLTASLLTIAFAILWVGIEIASGALDRPASASLLHRCEQTWHRNLSILGALTGSDLNVAVIEFLGGAFPPYPANIHRFGPFDESVFRMGDHIRPALLQALADRRSSVVDRAKSMLGDVGNPKDISLCFERPPTLVHVEHATPDVESAVRFGIPLALRDEKDITSITIPTIVLNDPQTAAWAIFETTSSFNGHACCHKMYLEHDGAGWRARYFDIAWIE